MNFFERDIPITGKMKKCRNDFFRRAKQKSRPDTCLYCRKPMSKDSGFCRSHTIPQTFLKNISVNGKVRTVDSIVNLIGEPEDGIKRTGIFQAICHECDNTIFQDYENPGNYCNEPPIQKMLAQIAMKNYLNIIIKSMVKYEGHKELFSMPPYQRIKMKEKRLDLDQQDITWYNKCFRTARERNLGSDKTEYQIIYYVKLPYVVPIVCQFAVPLSVDFDKNILNDIYNSKSNYHLWDVHFCVFPLEDSSVVLLFVDTHGMERYAKFYEQLSHFSDQDKLAISNYLIFYIRRMFTYQ